MDSREKVYELLKEFSTAMMVTTGAEGELEARPMQIAEIEEHGRVWFFTGRGGRVVREIKDDSEVLLVFQEERTSYMSLRGTARAVDDKAKAQELWKEPYRVWFPGGVDDPRLVMISVQPVAAEFWDNKGGNRLEYLFEAAKAYVTGSRPRVDDPDQHAKVTL
jgi:general stress protein 26